MTLETLLQVITKHGAVGVLAIWIFTLQSEVKQMKSELFDCLKHKQADENTNTKNERYERAYFVLPEKKRRKDEYRIDYDC